MILASRFNSLNISWRVESSFAFFLKVADLFTLSKAFIVASIWSLTLVDAISASFSSSSAFLACLLALVTLSFDFATSSVLLEDSFWALDNCSVAFVSSFLALIFSSIARLSLSIASFSSFQYCSVVRPSDNKALVFSKVACFSLANWRSLLMLSSISSPRDNDNWYISLHWATSSSSTVSALSRKSWKSIFSELSSLNLEYSLEASIKRITSSYACL